MDGEIKANPMFLGLDLRGGVHFTMQVDMKARCRKTFERYAGDIRRELRREKSVPVQYIRLKMV